MTRYRAGGGSGGRALAWTLVYALVFQLVLSSAFAATYVGGGGLNGGVICRGDMSAAPDGQGQGEPALGAHCPLCLPRMDVAALPPPPPAVPARPLAIAFRYPVEGEAAPACLPARTSHQPRAPPMAV